MNLASELKGLWAVARLFAVALMCASVSVAYAADTNAAAASVLRAKHEALQDQLARNQFQKPLVMVSGDTASSVTGDIYAFINTPFVTAGAALNSPVRWCDILMLHLNTKYCRASVGISGNVLQVNMGNKFDQPVGEAYRLDLAYRVVAESPGYLKLMLTADEGPLSTRDYRVVLEAVPLDSGGTFLHFTYSYGYGFAGKLALQAYLATIGRGKVGFTVVGQQSDGQPMHIAGLRGVVERNTMRYYLAIEAFLGALSVAPDQPNSPNLSNARLEKALQDWFTGIERYPRQLHELQRHEYLDMKRKEYLRMQGMARMATGVIAARIS